MTTRQTPDAVREAEGRGGFACPICGQETPHHHTSKVVDAYQNKRSRK
ncbi:hypothetical protein [Sphingomonas yabuuchiae]|uniref:DNA repair exonuclease SbcCD ATPase subunit n=1 Tax=Sphingomonas yabuuchiae TaxID=172044 RepID=A0AA41A0V9_9SPHN|nr:hypothetical protein [Sphingomonas yabuuchiae]MBB4611722.1 DNA repair exonuclease SbcCD ATPase subunit [Sphingomonas yabuuchiae]MBN3558121.1 hypothetical protein [Sphingomonas yabuuchiae]